jgi:gluconokinase
VLPFLAGERSPGWAGDVRATISGMTLATTPLELLRASLEAVAYRFALIERRIRSQDDRPRRLIASGGALLHSPAWMQLIADVMGQPLTASAEPEATSRGAALLALESLGAVARLADLPAALGATYTPDPAHHQRYQAAIERQQQIYKLLIG